MKKFGRFNDVIPWTAKQMYDYSYIVHTERWQGKEIKHDPKYSMIETLNHSFSCQMNPDINVIGDQIKPNFSWADEHFEERVSGLPLNPPPSHERWPYAQKNNAEFGGEERFSHTYPERIWPKYINLAKDGMVLSRVKNSGFRYEYGDFGDVVKVEKAG